MKNKSISYKQILEKKDYLPFYIYDYNIIKGQILKLKNNLPSNVELFYSAKANPNLAILKIMNNFNLGVEIISLGELFAVKKANFNFKKIFFAGSTKANEEFLSAIKSNVNLFSLESISEIKRINSIANSLNKKVNIVLRIDPGDSLNINYYKQTKVSGFGIPLENFKKIICNFPERFPNLILKGIHIYKDSRISNPNFLLETVDGIFSIIQKIENKYKLNFEIINIGGGFEANAKKELVVTNYCKKLAALIDKYNFNNRRIILELGRYLVNNSGTYVTEVIDLDKKDNVIFLTVKGILNHLLKSLSDRPDRNHFVELKDNFVIKVLPRRKRILFPTVICGQMSSSVDTFGRGFNCKFLLSQSRPGDFVLINGVGAYGLTQSLSLFGSHSIASEFLMFNNKLELTRDKGLPKDLFLSQKIPLILNKKD